MTRWYSEKKREHYYKEAKRQGYRARSAFKLKQIQKKYSIFKDGDTVLDFGAAPGGWSQVTKEFVGDNGRVIGIDLLPIQPFPGVKFIKGNLTEITTIDKIKSEMNDTKANVIISDMSPNISGVYSIDHAQSVYLCENALDLAVSLLQYDGNFICKIFSGPELEGFIIKIKNYFKKINRFSPPASRKSSSEIYIISKYFHP